MNRLASFLPRAAALVAAFFASFTLAPASPLADLITAEALIVTKAELRRHMAAGDDDVYRPATYQELAASRGAAQPDYLVVRFLMKTPGHYSGEAEVRINGAKHGTKLNVMLHFNKGWVEYFIPMDGVMYGQPKEGSPSVMVGWNKLEAK
jgi:hypothetical protein